MGMIAANSFFAGAFFIIFLSSLRGGDVWWPLAAMGIFAINAIAVIGKLLPA